MDFDNLVGGLNVEARPYQLEVVKESYDRFMGLYKDRSGKVLIPHKSVLIESPTGSGKTVMGMMLAKALQDTVKDCIVVWTAMRKPLLNQAKATNESMIGLSDFYPLSMFTHSPAHILEARKSGKKIIMVVDEAQHDAASSCAHLHNLLTPEYVIGLSATPYRVDKQKLCFEAVVKNAGIHALIDAGFLSKYEHYTIDDWSVKCVSERYLAEPERWGKSIFYFLTLNECFQFSEILTREGVSCSVVTGDSDCDEQIQAFETGKIDCLVNCMKLTEGFDCPSLQTVWVRDSSHGPSVQMCGRVLRKYNGLPVKNIVQSQRTKWPFQRTADAEQSYVYCDSSWRALKANKRINEICNSTTFGLAHIETSMPMFIQKKAKRTRRINLGT